MNVNIVKYAPLLCLLLLTSCRQDSVGSEPQTSKLHAEIHPDKAVARDELISTLASKDFDHTLSMMNRVKRMRYQGDMLPLLSDVWHLNLTAMPQVDKAFVAHPRIRLEVADVLMQASRNGAMGLEPTAYSAYARQHARSKDADIARQAILVLGVASDPADIALLTDILVEERESTFNAAALSLVRNCAVDERTILVIAEGLRKRALRDYFRKSWEDGQGLRSHVCHRES